MRGRDKSKAEVWLPMRVPLGLKVRHSPVTKAEDDMFNGIKYVVNKDDGSVMLHAEWIGVSKDCYSPMKDDASVRSACAEFATGAVPRGVGAGRGACGVPEFIDLDDSDDSTWNWKSQVEGDDDDNDEMSLEKSIGGLSLGSKASIHSNRDPFGRKVATKRTKKGTPKKTVTRKPPPPGSSATVAAASQPGSPASRASRASAPAATRRSGRQASPPKRFRPIVETVELADDGDSSDDEKKPAAKPAAKKD